MPTSDHGTTVGEGVAERAEGEGPVDTVGLAATDRPEPGNRKASGGHGGVPVATPTPSFAEMQRREALLSAGRVLSRSIARGEEVALLIDQALIRLRDAGGYRSIIFVPGEDEPVRNTGAETGTGYFPVEVNGHRHGTIIVSVDSSHRWDAWEVEFLEECADDVALAFHLQHLERVRQETFLRLVESEERFRQVFHQTNDAILLYDVSDEGRPPRCLEANEQACRWFDSSLEELRRRSPGELPLSCTVPGPAPWDRPEPGPYRFDAQIRRQDGGTMTVAISLHRFKLLGQMVMLLVARDVSEERRLEHEQAASLEQIQQNMEQFQILNDQIRNPVQVIIGLADLEGGEFSHQIILQAREIDQIVRQLDIGWLESAKVSSYLRRYAI